MLFWSFGGSASSCTGPARAEGPGAPEFAPREELDTLWGIAPPDCFIFAIHEVHI